MGMTNFSSRVGRNSRYWCELHTEEYVDYVVGEEEHILLPSHWSINLHLQHALRTQHSSYGPLLFYPVTSSLKKTPVTPVSPNS